MLLSVCTVVGANLVTDTGDLLQSGCWKSKGNENRICVLCFWGEFQFFPCVTYMRLPACAAQILIPSHSLNV